MLNVKNVYLFWIIEFTCTNCTVFIQIWRKRKKTSKMYRIFCPGKNDRTLRGCVILIIINSVKYIHHWYHMSREGTVYICRPPSHGHPGLMMKLCGCFNEKTYTVQYGGWFCCSSGYLYFFKSFTLKTIGIYIVEILHSHLLVLFVTVLSCQNGYQLMYTVNSLDSYDLTDIQFNWVENLNGLRGGKQAIQF
jgi:hypothetical protein